MASVRRRFSEQQRRDAVRFLREQRATAGRSWRSVAEELGICVTLLRAWCEKYPENGKPAFKPVEVTGSQAQPVIVTPQGFRVEGLSLAGLVEVLRALA